VAAVAGRTYPAVTFEIESERVADFARAIGADPQPGPWSDPAQKTVP